MGRSLPGSAPDSAGPEPPGDFCDPEAEEGLPDAAGAQIPAHQIVLQLVPWFKTMALAHEDRNRSSGYQRPPRSVFSSVGRLQHLWSCICVPHAPTILIRSVGQIRPVGCHSHLPHYSGISVSAALAQISNPLPAGGQKTHACSREPAAVVTSQSWLIKHGNLALVQLLLHI